MANLKKWGWAALMKGGVLTAIFITYSSHHHIKKLDYNLFDGNQSVAEQFFNNPPILDVKWNSNDNGKIETYLVNDETGTKVEIMYDMMPSNKTVLDNLEQRFEDGYKEEDLTEKFLSFAKKDLNDGSLSANLDGIINESYMVFQEAVESKNGSEYASLPLNEVGLKVEQDSEGVNGLYLTYGSDSVMVTKDLFNKNEESGGLSFGKYEQMLGPDAKQKVQSMFLEYMDSLHTEYQEVK